MTWWTVWWGWVLGGLLIAFLEVLAPAQIFLGFAFGAVATGLILLAGGPIAGALAGSMALTLLVFSALSLISWIVLRRVLGVRAGQIKIVDEDINDQ
ncbi:MAG: hypothetical protein AAFN59_02315 [Pseudomonadota bacterium]